MKHAPLVTVIIPTHDRADLLQQAVESVLAQTYPAIEIIVVADGCRDETRQRMLIYADRLRFLSQPQLGVSAARNYGLAEARGEWINFLDDDDIFYPEKIARQVAAIPDQPTVGLVHCRYDLVDRQGSVLEHMGPLPSGDVLGELLCRQFVWMSAPLIRRTCLETTGGFDETLSTASDYDLWLRIALAGWRFACVQQGLGAYRVHSGSMVTDISRVEDEVLLILERVFSRSSLPESLCSLRAEAIATWRFWLSRRYYALAAWGQAYKNLREALCLYPQLMQDREAFLGAWVSEALGPRVASAQGYIEGVLAYLPSEAAWLPSSHYAMLRRQILIGIALQAYARTSIAAGREKLRQAVICYPELLRETWIFRRAAVQAAVQWAVESRAFIRDLFSKLPAEALPLQCLYGEVLAEVNVARAFDAHAAGQRKLARRLLLPALLRYPAWLRNRGVWAILFKGGAV